MVDVATAEHHGICPTCEGYGGNPKAAGEDCPNELCWGSCPACWCPGCHDGQIPPERHTPELAQIEVEEWYGSFAAYAALHRGHGTHARRVHPDQNTLA